MGSFLDPKAGDRAEERADIQKQQLKEQQQKEDLRSAEATDETARRKTLAQRGGALSSLLRTSEAGLGKQLGG